ncbi:unnamed protein product [Triticum turgidum subsp. durum]|uniref:Pirin C-terminal domain-containing protein n=1 Tax=Triticum turgidum subsp. durum TaxID=4567 RepID=A0A9R1AMU4_TRITD|nr:unnamed protein product [Triticum turgidum subsp. durum]
MSTMEVTKPRQVVRRFLARPQHEGAGAVVRRSIGRFELRYFDPFLVLDEFSASAPAGFPDHPHRGFETVTYMLEPAGAHHLLLLGQGGDGVEVWNRSDKPLRFVLVAGEPIGEPVAQLGPFVMNTEEEIDATVNDFEYFINGFEKAKHWKSQAMIALELEYVG